MLNANLDTSDGLKEDALNQVIACMEVQDATIVDCKKKFSARLELTDTKPAAAVLDKVLEESAWKKAGELIVRKKNVLIRVWGYVCGSGPFVSVN